MSIEPVLFVNLENICHNYRLLKETFPDTDIAGVVKNNAYGLGADKVAKALYTHESCRTFFVAYPQEGEQIRPHVPDAAIYVLQGFDPDAAELYTKNRLIPVVNTPETLRAADKLGLPLAIQLETGLNRLGLSLEQAQNLDTATREKTVLILSHLASADEADSPQNRLQLENFEKFFALFPNAKKTLAASDGAALGADFTFDIIRAGAFLYGICTFPQLADRQKKVAELTAALLQIKSLHAGDKVGYNATFTAAKEMKMGVVSIGYGDGLFRALSNKGRVFVKQGDALYTAPIIGRVSMDNIMCDLSEIPDAVLEKTRHVYLLTDNYNVDEMGKDAGTIGYEVLSALGRGQRTIKDYAPPLSSL